VQKPTNDLSLIGGEELGCLRGVFPGTMSLNAELGGNGILSANLPDRKSS
jgi:hypothetical protein